MKKMIVAIVALMFLATGCEDSVAGNSSSSVSHDGVNGNTIAIYVVMDGSGSMSESVKDVNNSTAPKWTIANKALVTLGNQVDSYLKNYPTRNVLTGIILFKDSRISVVDFGVVSNNVNVTGLYQKWVNSYSGPDGGTPLGKAIKSAASCSANDKVKSSHIMIISDGENNQGISPEAAVSELAKRTNVIPVVSHFIAFDVKASVFDGVKKLGCGVVSASSGTELQKQVNKIVKEEILLEKED